MKPIIINFSDINENIWENKEFLKLLEELSSPKIVNFLQRHFKLEGTPKELKKIPDFVRSRFDINYSPTDK